MDRFIHYTFHPGYHNRYIHSLIQLYLRLILILMFFGLHHLKISSSYKSTALLQIVGGDKLIIPFC